MSLYYPTQKKVPINDIEQKLWAADVDYLILRAAAPPHTHTHIHSPDNSDPGTSLSTEWKIKVCMKGSTKEYIFERKNEQAKSNCQKWQVTFEKNEIEHISNIEILNPINRFAY